MSDNFGYMEYDFSRLNKIKKLEPKDARDNFLRHYQVMKQYKSKCILQFTDLNKVLIHEKYLLMNNEPRRKGKVIFFTGNVVVTHKEDLLAWIAEPIKRHDLIIPLLIIPVVENPHPDYILATQEDPVFEFLVPIE
ncbi:hypothetical protein BWI95_05455 [Kosakonia cowanii JCM 10956 = DSM 18146]|uniref:Uncharacterized protein n=1 Tax=Kosakonia cowanii JCM 10956 = DSM 18146 TaxID=1300165 RepID=A0A807LEQ4_9ENTR|nr:hypothetical protein [Kosakonia cowanii]APZ04540.1 hypothetical protein BWI95_05455 [Kosakonia cowanii JCM 10956 = DSM 18146]